MHATTLPLHADEHPLPWGADTLARFAVEAISAEARLTPKPGLVDGDGQGGHHDMDLPLLLRSAESLLPTFTALALLGVEQRSGRQATHQQLRDRVGKLGRSGETAMLAATRGVNTHRGALWTLGLLVTAAAVSDPTEDERGIRVRAARLAATPDSVAPPPHPSHGRDAQRRYGARGAVGEAAAGFPHIANVALPVLRTSLRRGDTAEQARLRALLALIATVEDTCVLHRGGPAGLRWMQQGARRVLAASDFGSSLERFSVDADRRRLSPGGSADLLAGAIFLDSLHPTLPAHTFQEFSRARL